MANFFFLFLFVFLLFAFFYDKVIAIRCRFVCKKVPGKIRDKHMENLKQASGEIH